MSYKTRLFWIIWVLGLAGVFSFLLVDLSALIAALPLPEGASLEELPPPAILKLVSLIQPTVLITLAVLTGVWLAPEVGLHAPAAEALAASEPGSSFVEKLKPQILPGVVAGLAGGAAIVLAWVIAKPFFTAEFVLRAERFNNILPAAVRFLYGGFAEEILLRWGLMTLLVWAGWRIAARVRHDKKHESGIQTGPGGAVFVAAIAVSAVVFGIGHLPLASLLNGGLTLPLVVYVITANSIFGIVAGFLYWLRGLESAMLAHMFAHVVLIAAISLSF